MDRSEVIRLAQVCDLGRVCGPLDSLLDHEWEDLHRFAALVAAHERDACAQLCDQMEKDAEGTDCCKWPTPADCAYVIRARSKE